MGEVKKRKMTAEENRAFWRDVENCRDKQYRLMHKLYDWLNDGLKLDFISEVERLAILKMQLVIIDNYIADSDKAREANDPVRHLDVQNAFIKSYFRIIEYYFPDLAEKAKPLVV